MVVVAMSANHGVVFGASRVKRLIVVVCDGILFDEMPEGREVSIGRIVRAPAAGIN